MGNIYYPVTEEMEQEPSIKQLDSLGKSGQISIIQDQEIIKNHLTLELMEMQNTTKLFLILEVTNETMT